MSCTSIILAIILRAAAEARHSLIVGDRWVSEGDIAPDPADPRHLTLWFTTDEENYFPREVCLPWDPTPEELEEAQRRLIEWA